MDGTQGDGTPVTPTTNTETNGGTQTETQTQPTVQTGQTEAAAPVAGGGTQTASSDDLGKVYSIIGYILPILFFLPLLSDATKNNPYSRFHANQQLILLILAVAIGVISNMLYMILYMIPFLGGILNLGLLVLAIIGVINAVQGETKELPVIGKFRLLK